VHGHTVGPDVVNDQLTGDVIVPPDVPMAPLTLAWYTVPALSAPEGVNVRTVPVLSSDVPPATALPPGPVSENVADPALIALLKVTVTAAVPTGTLVAEFPGVVAVTIGGLVSGWYTTSTQ